MQSQDKFFLRFSLFLCWVPCCCCCCCCYASWVNPQPVSPRFDPKLQPREIWDTRATYKSESARIFAKIFGKSVMIYIKKTITSGVERESFGWYPDTKETRLVLDSWELPELVSMMIEAQFALSRSTRASQYLSTSLEIRNQENPESLLLVRTIFKINPQSCCWVRNGYGCTCLLFSLYMCHPGRSSSWIFNMRSRRFL